MTSKARVPDGWEVVRLGDVAEVSFSGVDKKVVEGEVPVELCNYTDVFYNRRIRGGMEFMAATATPVECSRWALMQGDVLFTKDSETPEEIGIPSYVADDLPTVLCGYHLGLARPSPEIVNGAFLARTLASRASSREFGRMANGVTRFGLTLDATRALPVLLPPLPEQRAISTVLDSIDDAIERTEGVIEATEQLRDSLLHELMARGVPGWHSAWKDVPGLGTMPADWEVVRLEEVCEVTAGLAMGPHRIPRGNPIPYLTVANVQANHVTMAERRFMELTEAEYKNRTLRNGDVVLVEGHAQIAQLGRAAIVPSEANGFTFQNHLFRVRTSQRCDPMFVCTFINSGGGRRYFGSFGGTTSGLNTVSAANVKALPLPQITEQTVVSTALSGVDEPLMRARIELGSLKLLKQSTADALLTGQVRVGAHASDEVGC